MNAADITALRAFYLESRQQLFTYAVSLTANRESAEDVIQGVFERLLRGDGLPADLRPYVFRAVRNAAYDARRRTQVRHDSIYLLADDDTAKPEAGGAPELEPLLQRLSTDERETIVLKIYSGLTFQEIADLRDAPLPTVSSWYRRGLDRLKAMLNSER